MAWFTLSIDLDETLSEDETAAQHEFNRDDEVC